MRAASRPSRTCEHMFVTYVELHCHSAFSFLDGASLPDELVPAALELGYEALALTDHNSVSGSMEFAVSARALGLRADPRRGDRPRRRPPPDAARARRRGWSNLCRLLTRAHAHTRESAGAPPSQPLVPLETVLEHAEGLVCLSGCALRGVHDELDAAAAARRVRARAAAGRAAAAVPARRPRPQPAAGRAGAAARACAAWRPATFTRTRAHGRRCRTRSSRCACTRRSMPPSPSGAGTSATCWPRRRRWRRASPSIPRRSRRPRGWPSACGSISAATSATAIPAPRTRHAMRKLIELCDARLDERYARRAGERTRDARRRAPRRGAADHRASSDLAGFFLLHHDMLELAREVAVEVRGPDTARALLPPGRGRGSSVSSIVCFLTGLSHVDPIANELLIGRFLNEELTALPDIDLDFPRDIREVLIPRVHERYGHDRSALVAAFPDLPRARRDPRARQGAGAAAGGDRAGRARQRGMGRARGRPGHRERVRAGEAGGTPRRDGPLGVAGAAGGAGARAAAPSEPALGRDDRRHPAADRLLPDRARRRWRAARSCSGTRTRARTPAS